MSNIKLLIASLQRSDDSWVKVSSGNQSLTLHKSTLLGALKQGVVEFNVTPDRCRCGGGYALDTHGACLMCGRSK